MKFCDEWLRIRPPMTANPDEAEIDRVHQALKRHMAVCAVCQKEGEAWRTKLGRVGEMSVALLCKIADAAMEKMKAEGPTMGLDSEILHYGMHYILRVLQDWKLITWNESMLHVREEWARRPKEGRGS